MRVYFELDTHQHKVHIFRLWAKVAQFEATTTNQFSKRCIFWDYFYVRKMHNLILVYIRPYQVRVLVSGRLQRGDWMGSKVASSHRTASSNHLRGGGFTFVSSGRRVFPLFSILSSILFLFSGIFVMRSLMNLTLEMNYGSGRWSSLIGIFVLQHRNFLIRNRKIHASHNIRLGIKVSAESSTSKTNLLSTK